MYFYKKYYNDFCTHSTRFCKYTNNLVKLPKTYEKHYSCISTNKFTMISVLILQDYVNIQKI